MGVIVRCGNPLMILSADDLVLFLFYFGIISCAGLFEEASGSSTLV